MGEDSRLDTGGFTTGSRVGRYLLEQQIGHGGMAAVFKARDEQLGRVVALKILAPALAADQAFRQRFIRESRAAAAVDDPHIIPLFEAGEADGVLFIAMRYVPGGDVRTLLYREGQLPPERVAAIVSPVASALDAAHATGLVHRDVKPANMLLDARPGRPDHVYLSDFGLSKAAAGSTGLTGTGLFLGTVDYAAPEQIDGRHVDGRADQYALGCAAFEMLCGEPPFRRDHGMAVLAAHISQPPPQLTAKRPGLPAAVDAVFARVLAKSADDRFGTCGEFSNALREALRIGRYDARSAPSHPQTELAWTAFRPSDPPADPGTARTGGAAQIVPGFGPPRTYPTPPVFPPGWDTVRQDRRGSWRWPVAIAVAAIAVAIIAAGIIFATQSSQPSSASGTAGSTPSASGSQSGSQSATPQASWTPYQDPGEFTIDLPPGWTAIPNSGDEVKFAGSPPGFIVVVAWTPTPRPDAFTDWQQQSAAKAAVDSSYHLISVRRVSYRGYNTADWEFTDDYPASLDQFLDRGFIVHPGTLGFAIELYGPVAQFQSVYASMWQKLVTSFEPAS
jgi:serine/threonine protein kinase